ncbi:MAG: prolyl oligopeptidase family serine peptidase [Opitutae bacterium]|nr:prolyl oligopeptidase family serine peptidase [Opitutae bacterium]
MRTVSTVQIFFDSKPDPLNIDPPLTRKAKPVKNSSRNPNMTKTRVALAIMITALSAWPTDKADAASVYRNRINPQWAIDNSHFWYRNDLAKGAREFVLVDLKEGTREPAFDTGRLSQALLDAEVKGIQVDRLPLDQLQFDVSRNLMYFRAKGQHFQWNRKTHKLRKIEAGDVPKSPKSAEKPLPKKPEPRTRAYRPNRSVSPDGKWRAFTRDHNIFVRAMEGDKEIQLSRDGKDGNSYQGPYWSPNSNNLVAFRVQPGNVGEVYLVESSPKSGGRAKLQKRRYALPGDKFTVHELNWFDLDAEIHSGQDDKPSQLKPEVGLIDFRGPGLRWTPDGRYFRYHKIDRGHQRFRIIEVDTFTGTHRNIIDEKTDTFIWTEHAKDLGVPLVNWLNKTNEIIHISERDGWRHLYLVDVATGKFKNITKGEYVVRYVDRIDENKRQVWFRASGRNPGQDPYLMHYYRVNFDGSGLTALTEGNGWHKITYSPDRKFIIDSYSRIDMAPVHELRRVSNGKLVCELEKADTTELEAEGWEPPEVFSAKGRDGRTDIWGIICRPRDFDPKKKYPILEEMYAGPHDSYTPKQFSTGRRYSSWTDMGFVVVKMDGMGTANRSKAFHDVCWKNLKDAGFPDRILWHKAYAEKNPWYDISRVGIYGGSAGGQSSTGALLFHPEFYKVAVSSCGCHDNRMDKASWNEQWMGYPVGPQYAESSNIDNAHRLRGRLLLLVGELDKNVPPESTYRLVNALIKANKDFDFVMVPGAGHGGEGRHGHRRRVEFFRKHLMGIEPPNHNEHK